jgi:hypothetical protein
MENFCIVTCSHFVSLWPIVTIMVILHIFQPFGMLHQENLAILA